MTDEHTISIRMGVAQARLKAGVSGRGWTNVWTYCVLLNDRTLATFLYEDDAKEYARELRKKYPRKVHG